MIHVILCCAWGASTSLLVEKMQQAAAGGDLEIKAVSIQDLDDYIRTAPCDMIMLGPQVGYKLKTLQNKYADSNIKLVKIPPEDYAMLDGERVVRMVLDTMGAEC